MLKNSLLLLLFLAGSVFAAENVDPRVAESEDGSLVALPYISLRNISGLDEADEFYGDERAAATFGDCEVSRTAVPYTETKTFQSLARNGYFYVPDALLDVVRVGPLKEKEFWARQRKIAGKRRPVLYIHGYNMSFTRACKQAFLFSKNLGPGNQVILFSWPSDGALLNYTRDEADVYWSATLLEQQLEIMQQQFGVAGFDVVAHSLGARGLVYALNNLSHDTDLKRPLFNQLVLVAPDMDSGIFEQFLPQIRPLMKRLSLYVSENDKPLALSEEVHGYPRLGRTGSHLNKLKGVEIIDVSDLDTRSFSGHLYHLYNDTLVGDLRALLNEQLPAKKRVGLSKTGKDYWRLSATE